MLALHLPPEKLCPLLVSVALSFWCACPRVCQSPKAEDAWALVTVKGLLLQEQTGSCWGFRECHLLP